MGLNYANNYVTVIPVLLPVVSMEVTGSHDLYQLSRKLRQCFIAGKWSVTTPHSLHLNNDKFIYVCTNIIEYIPHSLHLNNDKFIYACTNIIEYIPHSLHLNNDKFIYACTNMIEYIPHSLHLNNDNFIYHIVGFYEVHKFRGLIREILSPRKNISPKRWNTKLYGSMHT